MSSINQKHVEAIQRSLQLVGPIQVIVKDQDGRTLSGRHRELADQGWPVRTIEVKDALEREFIILLSNVQRQPTEDELKFRLNRVAMEYWSKTKIWDKEQKKEIQIPEEKVCAAICELLAPEEGTIIYHKSYIYQLLDDRWKEKTKPKKIPLSGISSQAQDAKVETVRKAILAIQGKTSSGEIAYPHKDCKCPQCPGHLTCYQTDPAKL